METLKFEHAAWKERRSLETRTYELDNEIDSFTNAYSKALRIYHNFSDAKISRSKALRQIVQETAWMPRTTYEPITARCCTLDVKSVHVKQLGNIGKLE